jgi:multiple sugar transport system permease protein
MHDYAATLARYLLVGAAVLAGSWGLYKLLRKSRMGDEVATGYALITPWLLGLLIFAAYPFVFSLFLSFTRYSVLRPPQWLGLDNYQRLFLADPNFRVALKVTVLFTVLSVPLGLVASLVTAMLLNARVRFVGIFRTIYYLPSVLPAVSTALLWRWLLVPRGGLVNTLLAKLSLPQPGWFHDPQWVVPAFVLMSLQGAAGNNMVIFLAALKGVPAQLAEAAQIDGATWWARFRHVTVPQISPVLLYQVIMGIIGAMQLFTQPMFIQTPGRSGLFYGVYIYRTGWEFLRMGYACALAWVLLVVILLLTLIVLRYSRPYIYYEASP